MKDDEVLEILTKSVSQYGDVFIMRYFCPVCRSEFFEPDGKIVCECGFNFRNVVFDIKKAQRILVTGTRRKFRFSKKIIRQMYDDQDGKCAYCFVSINGGYEVEHIRPLAVGGTNNKENLCLSCTKCNRIASSKVFDDFYDKQRYIVNTRKKQRTF